MVDFYQQFELLDLVKDDGVKTFEAKEIATGRPVRVHLFVSPKAPLQAALLKAVDRLPETEARRILHRGKNEGTPYLVTDRLLDHKSLQDWVLAVTRTKPSGEKPAESGSSEPATSSTGLGATGLGATGLGATGLGATALGEAGAWKIPVAPPQALPEKDFTAPSLPSQPLPPRSSTSAATDATNDAADLLATVELPVPTGLFAQTKSPAVSGGAPGAQATDASLAGVETAENAPKAEPSEFTKMFQAPAQISASPETPALAMPSLEIAIQKNEDVNAERPPEKPQGEFTRMFQSTPVAPVTRKAPAAAPPKKMSEPGEFTRMFQSTSPASASPPKAAPTQGEFTRMFQSTPVPPATRGNAEPARPAASAPPIGGPAAPPAAGEFTRFFETPVAPTTGESGLPQGLPAAPLAPQTEKAGEFTRMFGQTDMAALREGLPAPGANATGPAGGGATQAFALPPAEAKVEPAVPLNPIAPGGAPQSGPGEYTRMFSAPAELTLGQPGATTGNATTGNEGPTGMGAMTGANGGPAQLPQLQTPPAQLPPMQMPQAPQVQAPQVQVPQMQVPQVQMPQQVPASPQWAAPAVPNALPNSGGAPVPSLPRPAVPKLALILGLVGLIVVAIAVVIYFSMAKR